MRFNKGISLIALIITIITIIILSAIILNDISHLGSRTYYASFMINNEPKTIVVKSRIRSNWGYTILEDYSGNVYQVTNYTMWEEKEEK